MIISSSTRKTTRIKAIVKKKIMPQLTGTLKTNALSADVKEKIKTALTRARNNYREVFVSDYIGWMKYESQGSFRLNKVARDIFIRYCPFSKEVRQNLASLSTVPGSV